MCLILLALRAVPHRPWLLLGNRDEYHGRPTAAAAVWNDNADVYGGRDLEAGGSWLAMHRSGRFATVTNVRAGPPRRGQRSRGDLVVGFVRGTASPERYAADITTLRDDFGPFNLIVGDLQSAWGASTLSETPWRFDDGVHVLSNGPPRSHWPKTKRLSDRFHEAVRGDDATLLDLLGDTHEPPDAALPDTGIGPELERFLAPVFIRGNEYGTRASTLAYARDDGTCVLYERRFGPRGDAEGETRLTF
jgi:uncharacterized protein with NRDE domain